MSKIIEDIIENVVIKPNKFKLILKWVVSISVTLISGAFIIGQFQNSRLNRLESFEKALNSNTNATEELRKEVSDGFTSIDLKIDKVYSDGYSIFNDYQQYNKKQLELIIDYGNKDRDMLKRILDLASTETQMKVQTEIEQAKKNKPPEISIGVRPSSQTSSNRQYNNIHQTINKETGDTIFHVIGATMEFIKTINKNRYTVGEPIQNTQNINRFDVIYVNK